MSEQDNEQLDSLNQPTEEVVENQAVEEADVESETEDTDRLRELNKKLFERAKKAEAEAKELKTKSKAAEPKTEVTPSTPSLPVSDLIALTQVPPDDVEEVVEWAKFKKISIREALKSSTIKTLLSERAEERKTAAATTTGAQKRSAVKATDESLLEKAMSGDIPESDADIERIAKARFEARKNKK